ncbi:MAG: hypothetical protein AB7J13_00845 [Pyrinomonadaceae bacterium]
MVDYKKIAQIGVRVMAISFLVGGILELMIILTAILLISRGTIPPELVAQETWFIQAVFWLIGGTFLYARSRSLGSTIVVSLFGPDDPVDNGDTTGPTDPSAEAV